MRLELIYDTETTGLPFFNEPSEDDRQPHMAQLAAHLVDSESRRIVATMDVVIRPEGWTIPEETTKIHGITQEYALQVGVSEELAVEMFMSFWDRATNRVAHNESFDARILRIALKRYQNDRVADAWKGGSATCTMTNAKPLMRLPSPKGYGIKKPNLSEAYRHFTGQELVNAHTAIADVNACLAVHWGILDLLTSPAANEVSA